MEKSEKAKRPRQLARPRKRSTGEKWQRVMLGGVFTPNENIWWEKERVSFTESMQINKTDLFSGAHMNKCLAHWGNVAAAGCENKKTKTSSSSLFTLDSGPICVWFSFAVLITINTASSTRRRRSSPLPAKVNMPWYHRIQVLHIHLPQHQCNRPVSWYYFSKTNLFSSNKSWEQRPKATLKLWTTRQINVRRGQPSAAIPVVHSELDDIFSVKKIFLIHSLMVFSKSLAKFCTLQQCCILQQLDELAVKIRFFHLGWANLSFFQSHITYVMCD